MRRKFNKILFINWSLLIAWAIFIFILSSFSFDGLSTSSVYNDDNRDLTSSVVHVILYAVFTLLAIRALQATGISKFKSFFYGFLLALLYGASDEWHQYFVPGRESHISDWLLDAVGAYIVLSFYMYKYWGVNKFHGRK